MKSTRFGGAQKAMALVPLALLSTAWTASLVGVGGTTLASAADDNGRLPDGTSVPTQAIEDPASYSTPGVIGLGVPSGSGDKIVQTASTNGIPSAALAAYQRAATVINAADKTCAIPWQLVGAIGRVESDHGRYGNNTLGKDGVSRPGIYGIALDGSNNTQAIPDTDAGQYDRDAKFDRAVGPMQFIPQTWSVVGVDADGDAQRNPQDIDDAALAAAVYLCSGDDDLSTEAGQRSAVYRYNHSQEYVDLVLRIMSAYMDGDYTSVPNSTTSAVYIPPSYNFARPTSGARIGSPESSRPPRSTGTNNDGPGTTTDDPGTTTPTDPADDPITPDPGGSTTGDDDPAKKLEETVKGTVKDPVGTVTDTLTKAEATSQCLASGISQLDVVGLLTCVEGLLNP